MFHRRGVLLFHFILSDQGQRNEKGSQAVEEEGIHWQSISFSRLDMTLYSTVPTSLLPGGQALNPTCSILDVVHLHRLYMPISMTYFSSLICRVGSRSICA